MLRDRDELRSLKEDRLRTDVIIPLLRAMGYHDVDHWHGGPGELGKDVVCWKDADLGRQYLAVVAKSGKITGATTSAGVVATQLNQAFGTPFRNKVTQEEHDVHTCWVVSNGTIAKQARDATLAVLSVERRRYIRFVDVDTLWGLVEQHLGVKLYQGLNDAERGIRQFDQEYSTDLQFLGSGAPIAMMETEGRRVIVGERHPGVTEAKPLRGEIRIRTDSPEGRTALEAFQRAVRTGEVAEIPTGEHVEVIFPEIFHRASEQLLGVRPGKRGTLTVLSAADATTVLVRIDVQCDDGERASLDYVELGVLRRGTEEVVLCNHNQPIPIEVTVTEGVKDDLAMLQVGPGRGQITAHWSLRLAEMRMCMAKPSLTRVISLDDGTTLREFRRDSGLEGAPSRAEVAIFRDLAEIERRIGRPIHLPRRELTEAEMTSIIELRYLLRNRHITGTWDRAIVPCPRETARAVLDGWKGGQYLPLRLDVSVQRQLFDALIPMGMVRTIYAEARLDNEREIREYLASDAPESIEIEFVPGNNDSMVEEYLNWGPESDCRRPETAGTD